MLITEYNIYVGLLYMLYCTKTTVFLHKDAAWEACDEFERIHAEHIRLYIHSMEKKRTELREKVGEVEKAGVDWTLGCLSELQQEVSDLRRREDELEQLSLTEDPILFLKVRTSFVVFRFLHEEIFYKSCHSSHHINNRSP